MDYEAMYAAIVEFRFTLLTALEYFYNNCKVQHVDLKAAFLNEDVDKDVLVNNP